MKILLTIIAVELAIIISMLREAGITAQAEFTQTQQKIQSSPLGALFGR